MIANRWFINDHPLKIPIVNDISGETESVDFDKFSNRLESIDWDYMPGDRMTMVSVLALDDLMIHSDYEDTRMRSTVYTLHLRAEDMTFDQLLEFEQIAMTVAHALDSYTVRDPWLVADVAKARELLSSTLPFGYEFSALKYKPFWDQKE